MSRYTHTTEIHNLNSPSEIVPFLQSILRITSVVDVGCGLGTFLKVFKNHGVKDVLGIDGKWCNKELLFKNIKANEFVEMDLDKPLELNRKYDLLISVEVAEHLKPERASSFVEDLTKLSDVILFSAAIPFQGGDHHYNEQWLPYWKDKFNNQGFQLYDVLRPKFWDNPEVFWWYKQNMVLFVRNACETDSLKALPQNLLVNIVHPELFKTFADPSSRHAFKRYVKLLIKTFKNFSK